MKKKVLIMMDILISLLVLFPQYTVTQEYQSPEGVVVNHFEDTQRNIFGDIIFSSIIFRHGDRNEVYPYPSYSHQNTFQKEERGQLIERGKQRAHRLGVWSRARYASLLSEKPYSPKLLKVYSSKAERTIQSAYLFLSGLFPPKSDEELWNETLPWQPVTVDPIPLHLDNMISLTAHCPRYNMEIFLLNKSPKMKQFYETYDHGFIDYIQENSELEIPRNDAVLAIKILRGLYDTLFVQREKGWDNQKGHVYYKHGVSVALPPREGCLNVRNFIPFIFNPIQKQLGVDLPHWVSESVYSDLSDIEKIYFDSLAYSKKMKRLKGGPLLADIIEAMLKKRDESSMRLFKVYSGHVDTLSVLLNSLGVYDGTPPPYSAAILIELRYKDGNYFVTVLYKNADAKPPILLELPDCKGLCTLEDFVQSTSWLSSDRWREECNDFERNYNLLLFRRQTSHART